MAGWIVFTVLPGVIRKIKKYLYKHGFIQRCTVGGNLKLGVTSEKENCQRLRKHNIHTQHNWWFTRTLALLLLISEWPLGSHSLWKRIKCIPSTLRRRYLKSVHWLAGFEHVKILRTLILFRLKLTFSFSLFTWNKHWINSVIRVNAPGCRALS